MKGNFSKNLKKIFSETIRGMKLKLGIHFFSISMEIFVIYFYRNF